MELSSIINRYRDAYFDKYASWKVSFLNQAKALHAISNCRTAACGEIVTYCPACQCLETRFHSCGHRSCPKCQNFETSKWLDRQQHKLLPVSYFLVTFTLPSELRPISKIYPKKINDLLFESSSQALQELAANPRYLGGEIGMTGVFHNHTRRLDFHPHTHYVIPGCAINAEKKICIHSPNNYLVPERALNRLFRGKFLAGLKKLGIYFPKKLYKIDWVVDCEATGKGESALKYLSSYLYRGVISEKNILADRDGLITFKYIESKSKKPKTRTLPGAEFLDLILQHTLPSGYRRVRDFGFLHGNAKKKLHQLQLLLIAKVKEKPERVRPSFICQACGGLMQVIDFKRGIIPVLSQSRSPPLLNSK